MEKIKKKRVCGRLCCIPGCSSNSLKDKGKHFYVFPSREWEKERKKKWVIAVRRNTPDGRPWEPTKNSFICSDHFEGGSKSDDPRKTAYNPTLFPWKKQNPLALARATRQEGRTKQKELQLQTNYRQNEDSLELEHSIHTTFEHAIIEKAEIAVQTDPIDTDYPDEEDCHVVLFCSQYLPQNEVEIQTRIVVNTKPQKIKTVVHYVPKTSITKNAAAGPDSEMRMGFTGFDDIHNETTMKQLGGISLSFFLILLNFIRPNMDGQPKYFRVLSRENRLLLFLMKMKLGLNFTALACIFKISRTTASVVFYDILETLYLNTTTWIFWPSKEAIKETIPQSFKSYPNCRAIIDCTEIRCDTPNTVEQRVCMYSSYKSAFTVKYLIAITPSGFISFISKGFGGRTTDGQVTNKFDFLKLIEPGDEIMADKGFPQIRTELLQRQCTLVIPPAAINPQFSEDEVFEGYSIASVRIHVERAIQRVKIFKILHHINIELLPSIDKIMFIACVLANNKEPIIRNE